MLGTLIDCVDSVERELSFAIVGPVLLGALFSPTEAVQQTTFSPVFDYTKIHHVQSVTPEFLKFLKDPMEMHIHVTQHVDAPSVGAF